MEQQMYTRIAPLGGTAIAVFLIYAYMTCNGYSWINGLLGVESSKGIVGAIILIVAGIPLGILIGESGYFISTIGMLLIRPFRVTRCRFCWRPILSRRNWMRHAYELNYLYFDKDRSKPFIEMLRRTTTTYYLNINLIISLIIGWRSSVFIFGDNYRASLGNKPTWYLIILVIIGIILFLRALFTLLRYSFIINEWERNRLWWYL